MLHDDGKPASRAITVYGFASLMIVEKVKIVYNLKHNGRRGAVHKLVNTDISYIHGQNVI